jgi:hypothetical protein
MRSKQEDKNFKEGESGLLSGEAEIVSLDMTTGLG